MTRFLCILILISMCLVQVGCTSTQREIELISISFPMGESVLSIWKNGRTMLHYGALPRGERIKTGTFDIELLYEQAKPLLHSNVPREDWPKPNAEAGMVQIKFKGDAQTTSYLIFDEEEFAKQLFDRARRNIVGKMPK